ncbi:hypothetical protein L665_03082 [Ralstonia solanacearum SD54]|nr:hypothetical protein L665_03082 [Ralstonia solanacearum SD54]
MGIHRVERLVIARARHMPSRLKVSVPPRLRGMLNMLLPARARRASAVWPRTETQWLLPTKGPEERVDPVPVGTTRAISTAAMGTAAAPDGCLR